MSKGSPTCPLCDAVLLNERGNRTSLPAHIRNDCPNGPNGDTETAIETAIEADAD